MSGIRIGDACGERLAYTEESESVFEFGKMRKARDELLNPSPEGIGLRGKSEVRVEDEVDSDGNLVRLKSPPDSDLCLGERKTGDSCTVQSFEALDDPILQNY